MTTSNNYEADYGKSCLYVYEGQDELKDLIAKNQDLIRDVLFKFGSDSWDKIPTDDDSHPKIELLKKEIREILRKRQTIKKDVVFCAYCRKEIDNNDNIEHILNKANYIPLTFSPYNLVLTHGGCNVTKGKLDIAKNINVNNFLKQCRFKKKQLEDFKKHFDDENKQINLLNKINTYNSLLILERGNQYYNWIHPYYDSYFECIEIIQVDTNKIRYRYSKNASEIQRKKANSVLSKLSLKMYEEQASREQNMGNIKNIGTSQKINNIENL